MKDRDVHVHRHSLITFDGYHAQETVANFWIGAVVFLLVGLVVFWVGHSVYTDHEKSKNPEILKLEIEREKIDNKSFQDKKSQYIEGCKSSGKSPGDMSDASSNWRCI